MSHFILNNNVFCVTLLNTHPSSLTLDPRVNMLIQVNGHPVSNVANQLSFIRLNTFHTQDPTKGK